MPIEEDQNRFAREDEIQAANDGMFGVLLCLGSIVYMFIHQI